MVTSHHEASHRIFQERPELLEPVFRILGVPLPAKASVEVLTGDVTEIRPLERRVDSVLRVRPPGEDGFLLAVEAQGRRDVDKAVSWAYYLAYLKAKYESPALLLVVCQDKRTAEWAAGPFALGTDGWTALSLHPLVLGPGNVPVILDVEEASRDLALATFSAMTHGSRSDATPILEALAGALGRADEKTTKYYAELLEIGLTGSPARETWRNMMGIGTYFPGRGTIVEEKYLEGKADGLAEGKAEGKVEERAQSVLFVLEQRGIVVSEAVRAKVTGCTDLGRLGEWLARAFTVTDVSELFDGKDSGRS